MRIIVIDKTPTSAGEQSKSMILLVFDIMQISFLLKFPSDAGAVAGWSVFTSQIVSPNCESGSRKMVVHYCVISICEENTILKWSRNHERQNVQCSYPCRAMARREPCSLGVKSDCYLILKIFLQLQSNTNMRIVETSPCVERSFVTWFLILNLNENILCFNVHQR